MISKNKIIALNGFKFIFIVMVFLGKVNKNKNKILCNFPIKFSKVTKKNIKNSTL